jgi:hypothetical protein
MPRVRATSPWTPTATGCWRPEREPLPSTESDLAPARESLADAERWPQRRDLVPRRDSAVSVAPGGTPNRLWEGEGVMEDGGVK